MEELFFIARAVCRFRRTSSLNCEIPIQLSFKILERHAENNIELTLDGVIDFIRNRHPDMPSDYKVFKEQFVVCWAGQVKESQRQDLLLTSGYRID
jgi:hypothetical protein